MLYNIRHEHKGVHYDVRFHVFSYCPVNLMFYYILYRYKGAHHYACVDV